MRRPARGDRTPRARASTRARRTVATTCAALVTVLLAGCSTAAPPAAGPTAPGSLAASGIDLHGQVLTVGGKEFDEQLVLCKAQIAALQSVGATVVDRCGIVGAAPTRKALVDGDIDMYWSYTGTGWVTDLGQTQMINDSQAQYEAVRDLDRRNGIVWTRPTPFDDTYAIAASRAALAATGVRTTSDWARLVQAGDPRATLCVENEFANRPDGLPNLLRTYGVTRAYGPPAVTVLDGPSVYQATANGSPCTFGEIFTTDGRTAGLDLAPLPDDRAFFPVYNASNSVRADVVARAPGVVAVSDELARRLDDPTVLGLNGQVTSQRIPADVVARNWLKQQGLIGQ